MKWATPEERRNLGQSRRKQLGRQQNDQLNIKARKTTALSLLERVERGRVPALLKLKHRLMADSPFGYFRGAAPVMAADLALVPNTGLEAQLCGDAHVRNLGAFAAPDGRLVFDINDFDETIRGPFEWDLKRMAASLVLAARESRHKEAAARQAVEECIIHYCEYMRAFARMPLLEVGRFQVHRLGDSSTHTSAVCSKQNARLLCTLSRNSRSPRPASQAGLAASRISIPSCGASPAQKLKRYSKRSVLTSRCSNHSGNTCSPL